MSVNSNHSNTNFVCLCGSPMSVAPENLVDSVEDWLNTLQTVTPDFLRIMCVVSSAFERFNSLGNFKDYEEDASDEEKSI